jgi:hypothetical protein
MTDEPSTPPPRGYTLGLLGLTVELLLPVTLCAALLLVLAGYVPYWNLRTRVGLAVFGMLLVALSLAVSLKLDAWTYARRAQRGRRRLLNGTGPRARLAKYVLGGVVIPIAALVAANRIHLPNHQTPMSLAVRFSGAPPDVSHEEQLGNAILRAEASGKVQGIRALQAMASAPALEQLLRVLREDPAATAGGAETEALSTALASYGERAKPGLLKRLAEVAPGSRREASAPAGDLFERSFAAAFAEVQHEVERRLSDPAAKAEQRRRLEAAEKELKRTLGEVEADTRPARGDRSLPAFVLGTFLQMSLPEDPELLALARSIAADPGWSDPVRGQALALIARLGGRQDLDGLYGQLEGSSPLLQARAMQAIAELQSRLAAP